MQSLKPEGARIRSAGTSGCLYRENVETLLAVALEVSGTAPDAARYRYVNVGDLLKALRSRRALP
jgi:hypothetical protein